MTVRKALEELAEQAPGLLEELVQVGDDVLHPRPQPNRSRQARIAALEGWARTPDRTARTEAMRTGLAEKFLREARDRLGPEASERAVADAADAAKRAWYQRLSEKGHAARYGRRAS